MMALRPCYRPDVSLNDVLAAKQDEQQSEENKLAWCNAEIRADGFFKEKEFDAAILNR